MTGQHITIDDLRTDPDRIRRQLSVVKWKNGEGKKPRRKTIKELPGASVSKHVDGPWHFVDINFTTRMGNVSSDITLVYYYGTLVWMICDESSGRLMI